jgi:cytochrome P450
VLLDLDAANRDPAVFDDPHRFDPERRADRHLSFGHGLRPCPGADHAQALAGGVIEAVLPRVALEALSDRAADILVAQTPSASKKTTT